MSFPLIFHPDVDEDLREARDFYEGRQVGLGIGSSRRSKPFNGGSRLLR